MMLVQIREFVSNWRTNLPLHGRQFTCRPMHPENRVIA
jgi:hypothetical protein